MDGRTHTDIAKEYMVSQNLEKQFSQSINDLESQLSVQEKASEGLRIELGKTVGRNIHTKLYKTSALSVVIVNWIEDGKVNVSVEKLEE